MCEATRWFQDLSDKITFPNDVFLYSFFYDLKHFEMRMSVIRCPKIDLISYSNSMFQAG